MATAIQKQHLQPAAQRPSDPALTASRLPLFKSLLRAWTDRGLPGLAAVLRPAAASSRRHYTELALLAVLCADAEAHACGAVRFLLLHLLRAPSAHTKPATIYQPLAYAVMVIVTAAAAGGGQSDVTEQTAANLLSDMLPQARDPVEVCVALAEYVDMCERHGRSELRDALERVVEAAGAQPLAPPITRPRPPSPPQVDAPAARLVITAPVAALRAAGKRKLAESM